MFLPAAQLSSRQLLEIARVFQESGGYLLTKPVLFLSLSDTSSRAHRRSARRARAGQTRRIHVFGSTSIERRKGYPMTAVAIKEDGSVATLVQVNDGGSPKSVKNVTKIVSSSKAFAALTRSGAVVTFGLSNQGGDSITVSRALSFGVKEIFSNGYAFVALKNDTGVTTWGAESSGGSSTTVANELASGVTAIFESTGVCGIEEQWRSGHVGPFKSRPRHFDGFERSHQISQMFFPQASVRRPQERRVLDCVGPSRLRCTVCARRFGPFLGS